MPKPPVLNPYSSEFPSGLPPRVEQLVRQAADVGVQLMPAPVAAAAQRELAQLPADSWAEHLAVGLMAAYFAHVLREGKLGPTQLASGPPPPPGTQRIFEEISRRELGRFGDHLSADVVERIIGRDPEAQATFSRVRASVAKDLERDRYAVTHGKLDTFLNAHGVGLTFSRQAEWGRIDARVGYGFGGASKHADPLQGGTPQGLSFGIVVQIPF